MTRLARLVYLISFFAAVSPGETTADFAWNADSRPRARDVGLVVGTFPTGQRAS